MAHNWLVVMLFCTVGVKSNKTADSPLSCVVKDKGRHPLSFGRLCTMFAWCLLKVIICRWAPVHWGERTIGLVGEVCLKPSDTAGAPFSAAPLAGRKRCTVPHSSNLPTVHCAQRSEFNTMANTLLPAPACSGKNIFVSTRLRKLRWRFTKAGQSPTVFY